MSCRRSMVAMRRRIVWSAAMPAVADWKRSDRRRMRAVRDRLREAYGKPVERIHRRPIDELVLTVLSQNTNDRNRDVAYLRLTGRFETWADVRDAPVAEVEEAIRPGGLAPTKAVRIQRILQALGDDGLDWLAPAPGRAGGPHLAAGAGGPRSPPRRTPETGCGPRFAAPPVSPRSSPPECQRDGDRR